MRILLVEDTTDLAASVCDYLTLKGHTVDYAADGVTGLHLAVVNDYDVLVLDVMLPGLDGKQLCRRLREDAERAVPVLMLTARDTLSDKLEGFESGADDYLVKPFALAELEVRLKALLRRGGGNSLVRRLSVADLVLRLDTFEVERAGRRLELPPKELTLLEVLMRAAPAVVSRGTLERALWGDSPPTSDALRTHMHSLRSVIDRPFDKPLLHTLRGRGYRLMDPDAPPG